MKVSDCYIYESPDKNIIPPIELMGEEGWDTYLYTGMEEEKNHKR